MDVVISCAFCTGEVNICFGKHGSGTKKVSLTNCCSAPVCDKCSSCYCVFCKIKTKISIQRKTSFVNWEAYCRILENYKLSMEEMPFMFWWLKAIPTKIKWDTMHTVQSKASYDAYVGKFMLLHLSSRFQYVYLDKMGMRCPNMSIVNVREVSKIAGHYVSINQSLPRNKKYRFLRRRCIIQALLGFISMIVMRMASGPHNYTHSDGTIEVVYNMNPTMTSSILRRFLSLK